MGFDAVVRKVGRHQSGEEERRRWKGNGFIKGSLRGARGE
jgi:hypothetical protein